MAEALEQRGTRNFAPLWRVCIHMKAVFPSFVFCLVLSLVAQPNNPNPIPGQNRPGPWDQDVLVYRVDAEGHAQKLATFERAGVPTLARLHDGRLIAAHQYFPEDDAENFDKVAMHFSSDEGRTWSSPKVIHVEGLPEGMRFPFDPTLVPLPDGRVRLYFTGNFARTFDRSIPNIRSAISTNGVDYTFEPGVRFEVPGKMVIDCAAVVHQNTFHLFAPDNGAPLRSGQRPREESEANRPREGVGYHAISEDGLTFRRLEDVQIDGGHRWLGCAISDGKEITFLGTASQAMPKPGQPRRGGIWMGTSTNGSTWQLGNFLNLRGADLGAVPGKDGGWIVVVTGPPRSGTPSALQRRQ